MNTIVICITIIIVVLIINYTIYKIKCDKHFEETKKEIRAFVDVTYTYLKSMNDKIDNLYDKL